MKSQPNPRPKAERTQKAVAQEAGVSQALISLVLRGQPVKISEATRQRILDSVKKVGYVPKNRHIFNTRQNTLAYIRPSVTRGQHHSGWIYDTYDLFFNQFQNHLVEEAYRAGYSLIVRPFEEGADLAPWLREQNLDGVFWQADASAFATQLAEQLPLVQINRDELPGADSVCADMDEVVRLGLEHLHARGHRRIAYLPNRRKPSTRLVYTRFVEERGLVPYLPEPTACEGSLPECVAQFFEGALFPPGLPAPTAVLAGDHLALYLLDEARRRGVRIPEDLSIMGIDNTVATRFCDPPLSTFDTRTEEIARVAVSLMFQRLKLPERPFQAKKVAPELVERASVAAPARPRAKAAVTS